MSCNIFCIFFDFSYLLGLLAKIKCSISSSQPDLWDCKQHAYDWRLGNFMKPYCHYFSVACNRFDGNVTSVLQYVWELQVSVYVGFLVFFSFLFVFRLNKYKKLQCLCLTYMHTQYYLLFFVCFCNTFWYDLYT